ncbi:MAG: SRPBCC family protein [Geodermatophilaceae bacterium]|nr:SRPBCC family protein [Geodermatophilaceae bacterium]
MTRVVRTDADTAYGVVSDVVATASHSEELLEVGWLARADPARISVADRFQALNKLGETRWTSNATVIVADPGRAFAFVVGDLAHPTATWTFQLSAVGERATEVTYTVEFGDGPSMLDRASGGDPQRRAQMADRRLDALQAGMGALLARLADQVTADPRTD